MFDTTQCSVTLNLVIIVLGVIGLSVLFSRYKIAFLVSYLFSMYWVYTLYQTDLLQMFGQNALYWSGAASLVLASLFWAIINVMPGRP